MLLLNSQYSPSIYNTLPHIGKAVKILDSINLEEVLNSLGQIFRKHGTTEKFLVTLVHRHFKLGNDEILIESLQTDGKARVSVPWILKGNEILGPANLDFWNSIEFPTTSQSIQPLAWTFGENAQLLPFEFQNIDNDEGTALEWEEPSKDFVAEVFAELQKRQLHQNFGIRVTGGRDLRREGIEKTDRKNRANIVTFDGTRPDDDDDLTTVNWGFDASGTVVGTGKCHQHHEE